MATGNAFCASAAPRAVRAIGGTRIASSVLRCCCRPGAGWWTAATRLNHIPDKYEHLVRYYGYYSNRTRGARRLAAQGDDAPESIRIDEPPPAARRKASWARLIQKVYEVDPLECPNCGASMRILALIDDADVIERILKHLKVWDPASSLAACVHQLCTVPHGDANQATNVPVTC